MNTVQEPTAMSAEKLYPDLNNYVNVSDVTQRYNKNLSDARIKEIQSKRHELEISLKHYKKILKRWKSFGNILKISSIVIISTCATASMVLGFGTIVVPVVVLGTLAAIGGAEGIISEA